MTPEQLRERLTQVNGDRMALAEDLFGVADFLRTHSSVQRALTDPARSQSDKDSLIDRLFGPVVGEVSLQCLHDLGQGHWSRPRDIVLKIEDAGCDAVLLNAQLDGVLEETEAQLVAIAVFLQSHRDLRNELSNLSALSPKGRADLSQQVFGSVVNRPTLRLLRRSVTGHAGRCFETFDRRLARCVRGIDRRKTQWLICPLAPRKYGRRSTLSWNRTNPHRS